MSVSQPKPELDFLDGLRAIAALWVLTAHCEIWGAATHRFIPDPKLAVDLFMILSGFLMVYSVGHHGRDKGETRENRWLHFYVRRYFRIAPVYYIVLIAAAIAPWFLPGYDILFNLQRDHPLSHTLDPSGVEYSFTVFATHVSFIFGLIPPQVQATQLPDWSLSLEMQFYLIFPLLYMTCNKYGFVRILILIAVPAFVVGLFLRSQFTEPSFLPFKLQYFFAGMLMCAYGFDGSLTPKGRMINLFAAIACVSIEIHNHFRDVLFELIFIGTFWLQLDPSVRLSKLARIVRAILGCRLARRGADASYGVYLTHGFFLAACGFLVFSNPMLHGIPNSARVAIMWAITVVGSYSTAWALHHLVERPGIKFGTIINHFWLLPTSQQTKPYITDMVKPAERK